MNARCRYKRRDDSPGPGSYDIGCYSPLYMKHLTHGRFSRSNRSQDTRDFYFGAAMSSTSASFGRDSPGPVYFAGGEPGKPFPGPRASICTAPGFSGTGAIQRPFLQPSCSPGPKYKYTDVTKNGGPEFSLGGRSAIAKRPGCSPGPVYNPNPRIIGNITQSRSGSYSLGVRDNPPQAGDEPGPGAFQVSTRQMNATKKRAPASSIHIRYSDRKGLLKIPDPQTPGPETAVPTLPGAVGSDLSAYGGFNRGPGHADAVMNMSLPVGLYLPYT